MIELQIDAKQLERVVVDLAATEAEVAKALNSTLRKMAAWVRTQSARGLSKELTIQQKVIRRRLKSARLKRRGAGSEVTVWYGLNPIPLIYLNARKSGGGVKASGGRTVDKGFIARGKGGGQQVFKRQGRARLPIVKQRAEIEAPSTSFLEGQILGAAEFEARFFQIFERELKWRTQTQ